VAAAGEAGTCLIVDNIAGDVLGGSIAVAALVMDMLLVEGEVPEHKGQKHMDRHWVFLDLLLLALLHISNRNLK